VTTFDVPPKVNTVDLNRKAENIIRVTIIHHLVKIIWVCNGQ